MVRRYRTLDRSVALFLLGALLMLPPVLLVFNRPERVLGIPVLYLYIFFIWTALIALTAALAHSIPKEEEESPIKPFEQSLPSGTASDGGGNA